MKKILMIGLVVSLIIVNTYDSRAQGGFGGIHLGSEFSPNGNLLMFGGGGAWVINDNFYLGGAGYGNTNSVSTSSGSLDAIGYGGFMLGYFKEVKNDFRLGSDLLVGSGGYSVSSEEDGFYFLEPNLKAWYSINSFMHLTAGVYYRLAFLNAESTLNQQDLSNVGIKLTLNFGKL